MKKNRIVIGLAAALVAGVAVAQTFTDLDNPQHFGNDGQALTPDLDANFALMEQASNTSVTNNETITVATGSVILTGTGSANDTTNTVVVGEMAAAMVGSTVTLIVQTASTNLITVADGAFSKLNSAWVGDADGALTLYVVATNLFVEKGRSSN
jgi:hypothetical protein